MIIFVCKDSDVIIKLSKTWSTTFRCSWACFFCTKGVYSMKIYKVISNNMVSVRDEKDQEIMLKGLSIGFKKRPGDNVDMEKIEKRFVLEDANLIRHFDELMVHVDKRIIDICVEIIDTIKQHTNLKLSDALYVTFIDHIHNLIDRLQDDIKFDNSILWDLRRVYHEEYKLASEAVDLLNEKLPYDINKDEANFITLHIVNAEKSNDMHKTYWITNQINDICDIVCSDFEISLKDNDYYYHRFIMHLRYMLENIDQNISIEVKEDSKVLDTLMESYPQVWNTAEKISYYINSYAKHELIKEEQLYIMIHLVQIFNKCVQ